MIFILSINIFMIIIPVAVLLIAGIVFFLLKRKKIIKQNEKKGKNISEWSYQRFCLFYGNMILPDPNFNSKLESIKKSILEDKLENIDEIAMKAGCSFDECILKIRYLKNKLVLGDYAIDRYSRKIKMCSPEEKKLLDKYHDLLYVKHYQIDEMATEVPNYHNMPIAILKEDILKDIKYLNDKMLINGITFKEDEKRIIYYSVEKNKREETHKTINCPKCGALVGVPNNGQGKCIVCGTIVSENGQQVQQ